MFDAGTPVGPKLLPAGLRRAGRSIANWLDAAQSSWHQGAWRRRAHREKSGTIIRFLGYSLRINDRANFFILYHDVVRKHTYRFSAVRLSPVRAEWVATANREDRLQMSEGWWSNITICKVSRGRCSLSWVFCITSNLSISLMIVIPRRTAVYTHLSVSHRRASISYSLMRGAWAREEKEGCAFQLFSSLAGSLKIRNG